MPRQKTKAEDIVDELNQEQLAAIYGISQQAISRRIIRAHKKIKTFFGMGL